MTTIIPEKEVKYSENLNNKFKKYPFKLSKFQKDSIKAFVEKKNSFISAPTGSGKTLPAEDAILDIVNNTNSKVFYTGPIKALCNQKFDDFRNKFKGTKADVGILTGDFKYNPDGNVLIMTTEILRNLLFNKKIQDIINKVEIEIDIHNSVALVIFDEIHYINDQERGTVWEESIIKLPNHIQMIMLSATLGNPVDFCDWVAKTSQRDVVLSRTTKRVVPLKHSIFLDYLPSYLKKTKEVEKCDKYNNKICIFSSEHNPFNGKTYENSLNHIKKTRSGLSRNQVFNNLISYLKNRELTPCIIFCFSRIKCEKLAESVQFNLLDYDETKLVNDIIDKNLRKCDHYKSYVHMKQFYKLKNLLEKGIAFHHSGVLPVFREIVEILYGYKDHNNKPKPLVKVLFATETFAIGVNMPTKTVVFTNLEKYTGGGLRLLYTHEYLQMAGRAGRRGIDKEGLVILLPNIHMLPTINIMKNLIQGEPQTIVSKFNPNYKLILKTILNKKSITEMVDSSLLKKEIKSEVITLEKELKKINLPRENFEDCLEYDDLLNPPQIGVISVSRKTLKKNKKIAEKMWRDNAFRKKYEIYKKHKSKMSKFKEINNRIKNTKNFVHHQVDKVLEILFNNKFITNDTFPISPEEVTIKGIMASQVNECNEILMATLFTDSSISNLVDDLDYIHLGGILSIFSSGRPLNKNKNNFEENIYVNKKLQPIINYIEDKCKKYSDLETFNKVYTGSYWEINKFMINATIDWLKGDTFENVAHKYNFYEGNLFKDFIKIYNLSSEISRIAEILDKNNLSIEAEKIRDNIIRDVVNIESLYIK
jgi:superfamily II RNA helicase